MVAVDHGDDLELRLKEVFGHDQFRIGQRSIIESILSGRPTLAVMPTGAGKSLCFQLPAVLLDGVTIVVSPLIALIRDQVRALERAGVRAAALTSLEDAESKRAARRGLTDGSLDLVYVAPERFRSSSFMERLAQAKVAQIVIDEAHCISQWGHDFRPDYARLGEVVRAVAPERVVALTATATPEVRDDILRSLGIEGANTIVTGFDRENLELSVVETKRGRAKIDATAEALRKWMKDGGSAIVYVATRKKSEEVAAELAAAGFDAAPYHAGLDANARRSAQNEFESGDGKVVVATTAFGMGVDKSDVRCVVHFAIPSAPESYYQEVGRAGRDGAPAGGVLIYDGGDLRYAYMRLESSCPSWDTVVVALAGVRDIVQFAGGQIGFEALVEQLEDRVGRGARAALIALERAGDVTFEGPFVRVAEGRPSVDRAFLEKRERVERSRLDAMVGYVQRAPCRRRYLVDYFGDTRRPDRCEVCDRCLAPAPEEVSGEALRDALIALSCVARMRGRYGKSRVVDTLLGSSAKPILDAGLDKLSTYGMLSSWQKVQVQALLDSLTRAGLMRTTTGDYPKLQLTDVGATTLKEKRAIEIDFDRTAVVARRSKKAKREETLAELNEADGRLFEALRSWRAEVARTIAKPPYVIAHDKVLATVATERPKTEDDLARIPGIGPAKLAQYGPELLRLVLEAG